MRRETNPLEIIAPPNPNEYLPGKIQKAIVNTGVKHPATLYPIALGISSGFVGWLFNMPLLYFAGLAGLLIGPIWAIGLIFFQNKKIGTRYLRQLNRRQASYERQLKKQLQKDLENCRNISGISDYALQAMEQLKNIEIKLNSVKELLEMKLHPGEITFGRFLGAAEQVNLSVLDNLKKFIGIIKSAGSIHPDQVEKRLDKLDQKQDRNENNIQKQALMKRLELWEEQLKKADFLLAKNEEAMTEMERVSAAIAEWQTDSRFADNDFESAIKRLQELAEQAKEYNH